MNYERLSSVSIFSDLTPDTLKRIYELGRTIRVERPEIIIHERQVNKHMYAVLSGRLEIRLTEDRDRFSGVKLATRGPGECIGEYSFIDQKPSDVTVRALEPTELFKIPHAAFNSALESDRDVERLVYKNLLVSLVGRLRASDAELDLVRPI